MFKNYYAVREWLEEFIPLVYGKEELGLARIENLLKLLGNPERKFKSIHVAGTSGKGSTAYYIAKLLQITGPVNSFLPASAPQPFSGKVDNPNLNTKFKKVWVRAVGNPSTVATRNLKVGLHISPHLVDIRERMQVFSTSVIPAKAGIKQETILDRVEDDNSLMPMDRFIGLFNEIKPVVEKIQKEKPDLTPSYFEILAAATFKYFAEEKVDWAVVEVGLGGRLDATNVLMPEVSVITNIGLDHTEILGDTVEKIAFEKAGIIKGKVAPSFAKASDGKKVSKGTKVSKVGVPVVTGATGGALRVIEKVAREKGAQVFTITKYKFPITKKKKIRGNLNWELAEKAVEVALGYSSNEVRSKEKSSRFTRTIRELVVLADARTIKRDRHGHRDELAMTMGGLPGRFEEIDDNVIIDGAHNPDKIKSLINFVREWKVESGKWKVNLVIGFKKGKDWKQMVDLLVKNLPIITVIATKYESVTDTGKGSAVDPVEIGQYIDSRFKIQDSRIISNSQAAVFEALNFSVIASGAKQSDVEIATDSSNPRNDTLTLVTGSLYLVGEVRTMWKLPGF